MSSSGGSDEHREEERTPAKDGHQRRRTGQGRDPRRVNRRWQAETKEEKDEAKVEIAKVNGENAEQSSARYNLWKDSPEWIQLRDRELLATRAQRAAESAGAPKL